MLFVRRSALTLALVLAAGSVRAQPSSEGARAHPFRAQIQMQVSIAAPLRTAEDQRSQQETARRAIYEMANAECRALRDVFGGECRMTALNTNTNLQQRHGGGALPSEQLVTSATATYEVTAAATPRP